MSAKKRYAIIMIVGVLMNIVFNQLIHKTDIPIWLDMTGTAFAAFMLEPAAGLVVGLVNNFILSVLMGSSSTLIYYGVSAATAIIVGCMLKKDGKVLVKRILPTMCFVIAATALLGWVLSIWQAGGIPNASQEMFYYSRAVNAGMPGLLANLLAQFAVKTGDVIASTGIIILAYRLSPASLRYPSKEEQALYEEENIRKEAKAEALKELEK